MSGLLSKAAVLRHLREVTDRFQANEPDDGTYLAVAVLTGKPVAGVPSAVHVTACADGVPKAIAAAGAYLRAQVEDILAGAEADDSYDDERTADDHAPPPSRSN